MNEDEDKCTFSDEAHQVLCNIDRDYVPSDRKELVHGLNKPKIIWSKRTQFVKVNIWEMDGTRKGERERERERMKDNNNTVERMHIKHGCCRSSGCRS